MMSLVGTFPIIIKDIPNSQGLPLIVRDVP